MKPTQVKEIRESLEMTQEEFARALSTNRRSIIRWEQGEVKPREVYIRQMRDLARRGGEK